MATLVVPDTNIFLHFQAFHTVSWTDVIGENDVVLVIVLPVIDELDKLKHDPKSSRRARNALSAIGKLFGEDTSAELDNGTPAKFDKVRPLKEVLDSNQLDPVSGDNKILATLLQLKEEDPDVVLVTADTGMYVRCQSFDIRVKRMPANLERPSADPQEAELQKARRELDQYRNALPNLKAEFTGFGNRLSVVKVVPSPPSHSFEDVLVLFPLNYDDLPRVYGNEIKPPTKAEVEDYNNQLAAMQPEIDSYFKLCREQQQFPYCSISMGLSLVNDGGKPADHVVLTMTMPDGVKVLLDHEKPAKPVRPKTPPLPGEKIEIHPIEKLLRNAKDLHNFSFPRRNVAPWDHPTDEREPRGPGCYRKTLDDGRDQAIVTRKVLSNLDKVQLAPFYAVFETPQKVHSFKMPYTIRSHSLPTLVERELHIVVTDETGNS